jgi:hypothetical protein
MNGVGTAGRNVDKIVYIKNYKYWCGVLIKYLNKSYHMHVGTYKIVYIKN